MMRILTNLNKPPFYTKFGGDAIFLTYQVKQILKADIGSSFSGYRLMISDII